MTNLERLKEAGLVPEDYDFTKKEETAIESLSKEEVNSLISSKHKLGEDFVKNHMPHGMMF